MATEEVEVAFNIELDTRKLVSRMVAFDRSIQQTSLNIGKLSKTAKAFGKHYEQDFKKAEKAMDDFQDTVIKHGERIKRAREDQAAASTEAEKKAAAERLKIAEKVASASIRQARNLAQETAKAAQKSAKEAQKALVQGMDFGALTQQFSKTFEEKTDWGKFRDTIQSELKDGLEEGFDSFKGKDISGLIKGAGKLGSTLLKGIGAGGGAALTRGGAKMQAKGADMGGAGGTALKAIGSVMGKLGPTLGMLAKLGPLLSTSAAIFAGIVKVMLDAESAAKGMNKEIVESAGAADILYKHGGDAQGAFKELDKTLDSIRYDATDIAQNMKYGMKAEDIINVTKGFNQAGVSLVSLKQAFKNAGDAAESSAAQVQDFGDLARMSFVYSRMMGVSLSEITEMQGEMFTEMGTSLSGIQLQFARMTKDAVESGIATNKFFNIIRGISADLALYTTRMGQATTMLKVLGKVMNPREAQKFMQTAVQGLKQMGEEDRIRLTLLAGEGKMRDVITKDLNRKTQLAYADLASASGTTIEEVRAAAAKGGQDLEKILEKVAPNQRAAFKSALAEIKMDKNAMQKGGLVGTAEAAANLSAAGALTATKAALQRFGGKGKLSEMTGIQAMAARKAAGVSLEQFRAMAKMEQAVDEQKDTMKQAFQAQAAGKADPTQLKMLERLKAIGITSEDQLKAADDADIIAAMEQSDQDALAAATEQKDYAAETAKATTSIMDKMETIIEGIFEFIYEALKDVIADLNEFINMVADIAGKERKHDPVRESKRILREQQTKENAPVVKALQDAMKEGGGGKAAFLKQMGPVLEKGMAASKAEQAEAFAKQFAKKEGKDWDKLSEEEKKGYLTKGQEELGKQTAAGSTRGGIGGMAYEDFSNLVHLSTKGVGAADVQSQADMMGKFLKTAQLTDDQLKSFRDTYAKKMAAGGTMEGSIYGAAREAKLDDKQIQAMMVAMMGSLGDEELAKFATQSKTLQAGLARPPAGGAAAAPPATGQQAAAAKAAAPGSGVAAAPGAAAAAAPAPGGAAAPGGSAVAPTQPAAPMAVTAAPPATKGEQAIMDQVGDGTIDVVKNLQDLWDALRRKGIRLEQSWMDSKYKEVIEKGALEAIRKGLFEYALYTAADPQKVIDQMKGSGFEEVGKMATAYADDAAHANFLKKVSGNAQGGIVTSVGGGLAKIEAAPGEGLASIGPGERILPAGAGGGAGGVTVNVNGIGGADLANYLKGKIADAIYEYKRREKFT